MENNSKKKVMVKIAGTQLTLLTDEQDSFVDSVANTVNERIVSITKNSYRVNRNDAALLCAVDFCGDKLKAEKKVRNLEAQISLYNVNMRRLREEIIALKQKAGEPLDETDIALIKEIEAENGTASNAEAEDCTDGAETREDGEHSGIDMKQLGDMLRSSGDDSAEDKIRTLERYLENRKNGDANEQSREEKIKYIESLLRR